MKAIVADRGQVTIPKALREQLGIGPRTVLNFHEENGKLVAEKVSPADPIESVVGCLKLDQPTDELIAALRGDL